LPPVALWAPGGFCGDGLLIGASSGPENHAFVGSIPTRHPKLFTTLLDEYWRTLDGVNFLPRLIIAAIIARMSSPESGSVYLKVVVLTIALEWDLCFPRPCLRVMWRITLARVK
jgi:hypothetical protein